MYDIDQFPHEEILYPNSIYRYHLKCAFCQREVILNLPAEGMFWYRQGKHVQDAFPDLTPGQREMLISGCCEKCWDEMFPPEEEDDD